MKNRQRQRQAKTVASEMALDAGGEIGKFEPATPDELDMELLSGSCSLPWKYLKYDLTDFEKEISPEAMRIVKKYLKGFLALFETGRGLFIHGPVGTGKTALATTILKCAFAYFKRRKCYDYLQAKRNNLFQGRGGVWVFFWPSFELMEDYFNDRPRFMKAVKTPIIVLDDIAKVPQDVYLQALDYVFRNREMNALPTIITSQVGPGELGKLFTNSIQDLAVGNFEVLSLVSESKRQRK